LVHAGEAEIVIDQQSAFTFAAKGGFESSVRPPTVMNIDGLPTWMLAEWPWRLPGWPFVVSGSSSVHVIDAKFNCHTSASIPPLFSPP
jgi:hypothetical protein